VDHFASLLDNVWHGPSQPCVRTTQHEIGAWRTEAAAVPMERLEERQIGQRNHVQYGRRDPGDQPNQTRLQDELHRYDRGRLARVNCLCLQSSSIPFSVTTPSAEPNSTTLLSENACVESDL